MNTKLHLLSRISVGAMIVGAFAPNASADQIVLIGAASPLTGNIAHLGKDVEEGAQLAVDEINAKGLNVGGQRVTLKLDAQDDAADPRTATQVAQKLVDDKVVAVVGHLQSGTSIPASRIYKDAGIVQISPSATNPAYTQQGFNTTFRVVATDAQQGPALASFASKSLKVKTAAIIDDSTAYGQGLANEFEKAAKAQGIQVVSRDATSDKAVDFRAVLTKVKGENPDIIMYGGNDAQSGPLAKQARQLGMRAKILSGDGTCTDKLPELAGDAADGVICSEASVAIEKMPGGKALEGKFEKRFGHGIQAFAPFSYDAVYVIADAMKRANSVDPTKVLAAMPGTNYQGVIGNIAFDSKGDLAHGTISIFNFKSGKKTLQDEVKL
ncbi:branched-chain amino acid ABC transporter substrate-binding protein [Paraburkholderia tropica]|uniref:branched-chain amino acid ABC transporter substrate-binding protein n=1 Tax=Paraburkholderia tropica TaxID=92647 RepID=UPI002AB62DF8|nr:branched-chain amino acid ABC transporter substrate-binding protein [Paraburkholderia tropica]